MAIGKDIFELEKSIGYKFNDISYLETALTHLSYTNEQRTRGINATPNERLEFLGDAVLQMIVSDYLYGNFKKHREGALTKLRQRIVCENTLAGIASTIDLGDYLNLGHGEEANGGRTRPKLLADAVEAVIAAVYLDSGSSCSAAEGVVLRLFADVFGDSAIMHDTDYKTQLQQLVEQDGGAELEYRLIDVSGPDHNRSFTVGAFVNNNEVGRGKAGKIQLAEMEAARIALRLFGVGI